MKQKAFIKLEKKLAVDLRPGDLFLLEPVEQHEMNGPSPVLSAFLRTNVSPEEFSDMDAVVYKVHIIITDPEEPLPPRVNPHAPPGMN